MLFLYGDESNTPGADKIWAVGFLFTTAPTVHMDNLRKIRKECSYELRELKYASTDYSQILCAVRLIDYFLFAKDLLSFADIHRKSTAGTEKHKNIYRKALLSKCPGLAAKCKTKANYYWPSFEYQKINVFYWKNKNASLSKSPSKS